MMDAELKEDHEATKALADVHPERVRIVCAANRMADGMVVMGIRHCCPVMQINFKKMGYSIDDIVASESGFIDNYGRYLTRQEAYKIAEEKGQYRPWGDHNPGVLYSEDLY
jgi:hypothetical protein